MKKAFWFLLILGFMTSIKVNATPNIVGGDITYSHIISSSRLYRIQLALYISDSAAVIDSTQKIHYTSSCDPGDSLTGLLISSDSVGFNPCVSQMQSGDSYIKLIYEVDVALPLDCSDWLFYWESCCRNPAISNLVNPVGKGIILKANLNNALGQNSSPYFTDKAIRQFCTRSDAQRALTHHVIEADGDSLSFHFGQPLEGPYPGFLIPWEVGFSNSNPISTVVDSTSGIIEYRFSNPEIDVVRVRIDEYRFDLATTMWLYVGSVTREILIQILDCLPASENWGLQSNDSIASNKIIVDCGSKEVVLHASAPVICNSISSDGSDFLIYNSNGILLPIASASGDCQMGLSNTIRIVMADTLSQNDSMHIISNLGNDYNTLLSNCGFPLPIGDSLVLIIENCSTIGWEEQKNIIDIYPNPFEENIEIQFSNHSLKEVTVYSGDGKLLLNAKVYDDKFKLDLTALSKGFYILMIKQNDKFVRQRIMKK